MTVPTPPAPTASPSAALPASAAASTRRANRPARPAMPGATALPPLDALDRTHRQMVEVLADLTRLMAHLQENGVDAAARRTATGICSFFAGNARQHHADEETLVFPALIRTGDKLLIQHVLRLQQDHGWLEEDWLELSPQLQAVAQGYSWYDLDTLRASVAVFTTLYQDHIALDRTRREPACLCPGEIDLFLRGCAVSEIEVDQALIGNARFVCERLEVDHCILVQADSHGLFQLRSVRVLARCSEVIFLTHKSPSWVRVAFVAFSLAC